MKREIIIHNKTVSYILCKSKRARRVRLVVHCDGSIIVTTPYDISENVAERFIKDKAKWIFTKLSFFKKYNGKLTSKNHTDYLKYRDKVQRLAEDRVEYFNEIYNFKFNRINIRNQKTRWGSCSKKRNLSFNYKILFLPSHIFDYIITHELCHLKEFNHSRKFWNLVAETIPNCSEIKKDLKRNVLNSY
ncbi:M48 family metallopeptidase [Patescibacteria group bacterium]|nr:M48 family metallopeptidase [Patescibacteria group bacterium]